ncbi:MAG: helix-turn-helix transcriptional regulator [Lachnospiraceae bacterium]|nr:helix-turn-helix transcriptional regulator [Lachnospiraceae bacterium]
MQWVLTDIPLGRNIQSIRMEKGMTQMQVAEQLQLMGSMMSRSTLANIEAGRRNSYCHFPAVRNIPGWSFKYLLALVIHMRTVPGRAPMISPTSRLP